MTICKWSGSWRDLSGWAGGAAVSCPKGSHPWQLCAPPTGRWPARGSARGRIWTREAVRAGLRADLQQTAATASEEIGVGPDQSLMGC